MSDFEVRTNSDLAKLAAERGFDVDRCNADKKALREWAAEAARSTVPARSDARE